jgi:type II secretory pathway pseudopilin PulG
MVLAIIAFLATIAAPRITNAVTRQRADAMARRIAADLQYARQRATTTSQSQTVQFVGVTAYRIVGMPHPDHPGQEYTVNLADDPYGAEGVSADFGGDNELIFDIYGLPDSGGEAVIRVGNHARTITVDAETGEASVSE